MTDTAYINGQMYVGRIENRINLLTTMMTVNFLFLNIFSADHIYRYTIFLCHCRNQLDIAIPAA